MIVSTQLFEAYLDCPTKCWLLSRAEPATGNIYAQWAREQNDAYCNRGRTRLLMAFPESDRAVAPPVERNFVKATWRLAVELRLRTNDLESSLWAVERTPQGRGKPAHFVPYRFGFANKLTKNDRLSLAFDAFVLSEMIGRAVTVGKIIHGDRYTILTVRLASLRTGVQKLIKAIAALLADDSPPNLVLNRHCDQCEFQTRCRKRAIEKDELTLLSGMSENERKKLRDKGIFTVTQLSYTFRPRRRRCRSLGTQEKFHHSLRALAIRENKIHTVDLLEPKFKGMPVYLDVEGLPDRDFYYLIGARVGTDDGAIQYCYWADDKAGEGRIWNEFIDVLSALPDPQLIHFGNYETIFLKRMCERYGAPREGSTAATAIKDALNLVSFIFARIYFPTFSNRLKEIASYLGFRWSSSLASGLEAIVWRYRWGISKDLGEKQALIDYNREDCEALELVSNRLVDLHCAASAESELSHSDVVRTSEMKQESLWFKRNEFVLPEMETINKAAYWDYQRERVYVKSECRSTRKRKRHASPRIALRPNTTIECPRPQACPTCKSKPVYRHGKRSKIVIDLKFMRHGIKRWVVRHVAQQYRCPSCKSTFYPPNRTWTAKKYGENLVAYAMYQTIDLRLPQSRVAAGMNQLFGLSISRNTTNRFKIDTAQTYQCTYDDLLKRLCNGRLLHIDETTVSVMGKDSYVWVLTSMEEVAYFYTPTREGSTIQTMLKSFSGVLVSDFYTAYDAIECPQQKCLIHFIRDLNDELLNYPYDEGLKRLAEDFARLVKPMVETVDRRGLKKRFLRKHGVFVDQFYKGLVDRCASEATRKLVERLQKNRNKMFTFLEFDGVPWNNNNAEHAVKAFVSLRRVIEGPTTGKGIHDFLVLLSLCETCKYKKISFLDFLRSGSKDIDHFANSRWGRAADRV